MFYYSVTLVTNISTFCPYSLWMLLPNYINECDCMLSIKNSSQSFKRATSVFVLIESSDAIFFRLVLKIHFLRF